MDANTIIRLLDAGYTKEEITAMETVPVPTPAVETPTPTPTPAPVETPAVVEAPVAVAEPAPAPTPAPTPAQEQPSLSDVMHQIAKLTASIQANALANTTMPTTGGSSVEDVMAQIIKPTRS